MSETMQSGDDPVSTYDEPIVGLSFYADDPAEPIAGFGERIRLPVPEVGETVAFASEDLDDPRADDAGDTSERYRVVDRSFEYRNVEYSGFSGEGRRQVVVVVAVEVEPIRVD